MSETKWERGWGNGVTGPTCPSVGGPTVGNSVALDEWKADKSLPYPNWGDFYDLVVAAEGGYHRVIAICPQPNATEHANKIAAAPDLYKAAQLAIQMFERKNVSTAECDWLGDDEHEAWRVLGAACKKARGEA